MRLERHFTVGTAFPYDLGNFESSFAAAEILADAFYQNAPVKLTPVEENTLPSWLWRRRGDFAHTAPETSLSQIFDRIAGSAAYSGWKRELWKDETEAHAFYDDVRYMLVSRLIALEPRILAKAGIAWAYGAAPGQEPENTAPSGLSPSIENTTIDALLCQPTETERQAWKKLLREDSGSSLIGLRFADTEREWGGIEDNPQAPKLMLDALKFLKPDGSFDIQGLRHAVRLSTILLDLQYDGLAGGFDPARVLKIGYANMAPLLMTLGLAYDSAAGRATAAAISAIITAESVAASAELASFSGPCPAFASHRSTALRALRNMRRAAYGERNDYERISIRPAPLDIEAGADLVFVAAARRCWDEALDLAQQHGLRHLRLTELFAAAEFAVFLETSAQGAEPETRLVRQREIESEVFRRIIHPAVPLALIRLGCDPSDIKAIIDYAVGYGTLIAAPGIGHAQLRERGFDGAALARLESALPRVNHIGHAFTVWTLGENFCKQALKVGEKDVKNPHFDLLKHLKFTEKDIREANNFCCGHGKVIGATELPRGSEDLFTVEIPAESQIRMAAAVQSFIMGDANLTLSLPYSASSEARAELALDAWKQGLKSITLYFEGARETNVAQERAAHHVAPRKLLKRAAPTIPAPIPSLERTTGQMTSPHEGKPLSKHKTKAAVHDASMKREKIQPSTLNTKN